MSQTITQGRLRINANFKRFVDEEVLPGTGLDAAAFWRNFDEIVHDLAPENRQLLAERDRIQAALDEWHRSNPGPVKDKAAYKSFLRELGYLVPQPERVTVETTGIDSEITSQAGPQLVVPAMNARYALNAANARWGSLYDALYGSDIIPQEGAMVSGYDPQRGEQVIAWVRRFLDESLPLENGSYQDVVAFKVVDKQLRIQLKNGKETTLRTPAQFVGDNLLARGFHVRALTRTARAHVNDNLTWVRGSLEDTHSLSELVAGASVVVHCAGQVRGHKEEIFTRCNVDGSLRLMQAAKESGFCQRFLFISSLAARHPELSWYAKSKYVAEQRLAAMADEITLGVFRPTAVYGPGDKELKPLFDWMLRGLLPRLGTPETQLSFLHVTDFAQAVGQWLSAETVQTQTYELCDGVAGGYDWQRVQQLVADVRCGSVRMVGIPLPLLTCLADISTALSRLAGKEPMLTRSKIRELTHADWSASNNRISEDINWFPGISLEHALRNGLF